MNSASLTIADTHRYLMGFFFQFFFKSDIPAMLAQGQFGRQLTINEPTRSRRKGESNAHALNVKVKEIQPSVRKYFRSTVKYVITPHTPKTAII